jgi:hypothetical protein
MTNHPEPLEIEGQFMIDLSKEVQKRNAAEL